MNPTSTTSPLRKKRQRFRDLSGQRFGHLAVVSLSCVTDGYAHWNVVCDCGRECVKQSSRLTNRRHPAQFCSVKCPIFQKHLSDAVTKHGLHKHPIYKAWRNTKERCYNPKYAYYRNYGGRGIEVCEKWRDSFDAFYEDMWPTWQRGLQLDRVNNDGDYAPENCKWSTPLENTANRRNSVLTAVQISTARRHGISISALRDRIKKGWPIPEATTQAPIRGKRSPYSK
jgi:hypothetical protein